MLSLVVRIITFLFLFLSLASSVHAVTVNISGLPVTMDQSDVISGIVNLTCSGCSDSYLRGVFYPSGTSYFGYTLDSNSNWSNAPASSCTSFFKVGSGDLTPQGTWSGTLKFKLDQSNGFYAGPGEYLFKVGRYTSSCGSPTWSVETTIMVTGPTATPTPAATATPNPTNSPTPTSQPTATPKPTASPTMTPKPTQTITPSISTATTPSSEGAVLASSDSAEPHLDVLGISAVTTPPPDAENNSSQIPWTLGVGVGLIVATCAILVVLYVRHKEVPNNES